MVDHTIVDHRGVPFKRSALTAEPQTARLGQLHTEFEHHPSSGLTPGKLANILRGAEQGDLLDQCNLFADIEEKDGHVMAEMGKRKRALLGLSWDIVPPRNASKQEEHAAELAKEIIGDMPNIDDIILDMADAIGYAYSNLEMTWEMEGKEWLPGVIDHRPPAWFTVMQKDRDDIRLRDGSMDGEPLQPFTWIKHVHKSTSGYLPRAGLHRVLAWPFLFKNYSVRDLAEFLEIYGLPMRLGTYPSGASDDEKSTLLRAVTTIGHSAAGIVPEGMMIDFKDAAEGHSDPYQAMIDWCERTQSKVILGGTLTSQADGASSTNALGNVHNEVRHDLLVSDARQIGGTLTRDLVYPLCLLNTGAISSMRRCPRFRFATEQPEDIELFSKALPALANAGTPIPVSYVQKKLHIPAPEEGEAILGRSEAPTVPVGEDTTALKGRTDDEPEPGDVLADKLDAETNAPMTTMIDRIKSMVDESESFEVLQGKLLDEYGSLEIDDLQKTMALAFATTDLAGRFDVNEGQ